VGIGVMVGVGGAGVKVIVAVGMGVSVGVEIDAGAQETRRIDRMIVSNVFVFIFSIRRQAPNGLRYLRVGGRGFCLGAGKTRSQKNT